MGSVCVCVCGCQEGFLEEEEEEEGLDLGLGRRGALLGEELKKAFRAEGTASGFAVPLAARWCQSRKRKP